MEIIHQGDQSINQLLQMGVVQEQRYRLNKCILYEEIDDEEMLLCNSLSGELVLLSQSETRDLKAFPRIGIPESLLPLAMSSYIVPVDYDESKIIDQLRIILRKRLFNTYRNYIILPTTYCNARCFYCYESEIEHIHMTEETAEKVIDFIEKNYDGKQVTLDWFGGEPLLGRKIINKICKELSNREIAFTSKMVSNGYLFDHDIINEAIHSWKLSLVQITLDGTEKIYNDTKAYVNISENAYLRVMKNICDLLDNDIKVNVRLNLDKHNKDNLLELIEDLDQKIENKQLLTVYVSVLNENVGFAPLCHEKGEIEELWQYVAKLQSILIQKNMNHKVKRLPHIMINHCMADGDDQLLCSPDGTLGKCEHYVDKYSIGSVDHGVNNVETINWWKEREVYQECKNCSIAATCIRLQNCPVNVLPCTEKERERKIKAYKKIMKDYYLAKKAIIS